MTPASDTSLLDGDLARKAANGDEEAFDILFARHRRMVLAVLRKTVGGSKGGDVDVEDLLQDVFLKAYQNLSAFSGDKFGSWLCRIAVNSTIDLVHRTRERRKEVPFDPPAGDRNSHKEAMHPGPSPEKVMTGIALWKCLADLSENERQVIILKFCEGLGHEETAERLGRTVANQKVLFAKAMRHVEKLLTEGGFGP